VIERPCSTFSVITGLDRVIQLQLSLPRKLDCRIKSTVVRHGLCLSCGVEHCGASIPTDVALRGWRRERVKSVLLRLEAAGAGEFNDRSPLHQVGRMSRAKPTGLPRFSASWARRSSTKAVSATAIWMRTAFGKFPRK